MKQFFKTCHVFRHPKAFFVFGVLNTPFGGITIPPATCLSSTTTNYELGEAALRIISGLPNEITEVNLSKARQPYLAYLKENGFKSPAAFEKKASLVAVHFDGESYEIVPHQKDENGAFVAAVASKISHTLPAQELGKAVLVAFRDVL